MRYNLSLYSCSSEAPELLQRWQGYLQELGKDSTECKKLVLLGEAMSSEFVLCILIADSLFSSFLLCLPVFSSVFYPPFLATSTVPSSSVPQLLASQQDSDILLTWGEIPLVSRRGFLLGYNIYITNGSQLTLLGKC